MKSPSVQDARSPEDPNGDDGTFCDPKVSMPQTSSTKKLKRKGTTERDERNQQREEEIDADPLMVMKELGAEEQKILVLFKRFKASCLSFQERFQENISEIAVPGFKSLGEIRIPPRPLHQTLTIFNPSKGEFPLRTLAMESRDRAIWEVLTATDTIRRPLMQAIDECNSWESSKCLSATRHRRPRSPSVIHVMTSLTPYRESWTCQRSTMSCGLPSTKIREGVYQDESWSLVDLAEKSMVFLSRPHYEVTESFKDLLTCYQNEQGAGDTLQQHCYDIYGMELAMGIDAEGSWRTELDQLFNDLAIEPRRLNYDAGRFQDK